MKAGQIAQRLLKHPSTVTWFMYCNGLQAPAYSRVRTFRRRSGLVVKPFSPAEDAFIEAQRADGAKPLQIAELTSAHFQFPRSSHTIRCRLVMLAAREAA
ncbi:MAG: hypothetical protein ACYDD1_16160 [Caulobacteraceae bacterium]